MSPDTLLLLVLPLLIFDGARYLLPTVCVWFYDHVTFWMSGRLSPGSAVAKLDFCPSVSLIVAGLNEGANLHGTLEKLWGSYPRLEIIVVDDGSTDNMAAVARQFAAVHKGVSVISKSRGGKSSGMNAGLALATGEVTIILDADSELSPGAIWHIVQPMADPSVGAVSGNVRVRNTTRSLLTRIQAFEYLRSVFMGRIVSSRLGILGIVSGAFGAFRTSLLRQMGGWDVGPGEDEEIVLRIRKLGYQIEFVPLADCLTDVPESWKALTQQRRRWEWAVVTFESRKHIDMANPLNRHFRLSNFILFAERWVYNLLLPLWFWVYVGWVVCRYDVSQLVCPAILFYTLYMFGDLIQYLIILDYSPCQRRDISAILVVPLMPIYQLYQRLITTFAIVEEICTRRSFCDGYVPRHVREATWHW